MIFSTNAFVLSAAEDLFKNISTLCYYLIQDHLQNYYINHVNQDDKSILDIDLTFDKSEELINKMRYDYPGESILIDEKKFNIAREMASKALEYISHVTSCALNVLQELPELEPAMEALYKIALAAISTEPSE